MDFVALSGELMAGSADMPEIRLSIKRLDNPPCRQV